MQAKPSKDHSNPSSYRSITVFNSIRKLFEEAHTKRILEVAEKNHRLGETQAAYSPGRGMTSTPQVVALDSANSFRPGRVDVGLWAATINSVALHDDPGAASDVQKRQQDQGEDGWRHGPLAVSILGSSREASPRRSCSSCTWLRRRLKCGAAYSRARESLHGPTAAAQCLAHGAGPSRWATHCTPRTSDRRAEPTASRASDPSGNESGAPTGGQVQPRQDAVLSAVDAIGESTMVGSH